MTNIIIGLIGCVLFVGLSLASASYLGENFLKADDDVEAARFISEGAQITQAHRLYETMEGKPLFTKGETAATADAGMERLVSGGYLKSVPQGGVMVEGRATSWHYDGEANAFLANMGKDLEAAKVCKASRAKLGFTGPPKHCLDPSIAYNDPCCVN